MKKPRFTLRALLVIIAFVAISLWLMLPLPITESRTTKVIVGNSQSQVRKQLGAPHDVYSDLPVTWRYSVLGTLHSLYVEFDESGRVISTKRLAYILRNPD